VRKPHSEDINFLHVNKASGPTGESAAIRTRTEPIYTRSRTWWKKSATDLGVISMCPIFAR
jgi:hypothetical protein